ncbi:MAG: polysaccharide biosynthesis/export family protein [Bacteroidales bacterium]
MKQSNKLLVLLVLVLISLGFFSCVSHKDTLLLQETEDTIISSQKSAKISFDDYYVQPGDFLMIRLFSFDEESNAFFNSFNGSNNNYNVNEANIYLSSYMVNDSGYVQLPLIGDVFVKDKNINQIQDDLNVKMSYFVMNPSVTVKLVGFNISVLGEVGNPGRFMISKNRINILEAIALAGDLNTYANRKQVKIIRSNKGTTEILVADISRKDLIYSDNYYLRPNDIIYVEPLRSKHFTFESFPYALVLTTITSTITTYLLILNYIKKPQ